MKLDELPSTTTDYWEKGKMKRKRQAEAQDIESEQEQDPQMMEMRRNPNLRPMGRKRGMRKSEKVRKAK